MTVDPDLAKRLAEYYAPECRFDSREKFFPCGIDWMAARSSLRCKTWHETPPKEGEEGQVAAKQDKKTKHWVVDTELLKVGEVTDPVKANEAGNQHGEGAVKHEYRLEPVAEAWEGQSDQELSNGDVPCYYSVVPAPCDVFDDNLDRCINNVCDDVYEITYYMVYAYNGNVFAPFNLCKPIQVGTHTGDLEQVVIYVKDPQKLTEGEEGLVSSFQYRHAGEGRFCETPNMVEDVKDGAHCIVYPASESHASYDKPSWTLRIFGFANDLHNGKGRKWQTWKNLVAIDKAKGQPNWIQYTGRFGGVEGLATRSNLGRPGFGSRSCSLPAFFPVDLTRAKPETAPKRIPKKLVQAVRKMKQG